MQQEMNVLGIDIAKRVFHAIGMDNTGKIVFRKRLSRHDLMPFMAKLPPVLIGMEACGGAHDWARRFRERVQERPAVGRLARVGAAPTCHWRKGTHSIGFSGSALDFRW